MPTSGALCSCTANANLSLLSLLTQQPGQGIVPSAESQVLNAEPLANAWRMFSRAAGQMAVTNSLWLFGGIGCG